MREIQNIQYIEMGMQQKTTMLQQQPSNPLYFSNRMETRITNGNVNMHAIKQFTLRQILEKHIIVSIFVKSNRIRFNGFSLKLNQMKLNDMKTRDRYKIIGYFDEYDYHLF